MKQMLIELFKGESGQGMAEYGLILALVAVIAIAGLTILGKGVGNNLNKVANELD